MNRASLASVLAALAILAAAGAMLVAANNPNIESTSRGDTYQCLAPWNTVLNDESNFPGGEPPPDGDDIAARCRAAGEARFEQAVWLGLMAAALGVASAVASLGMRRRRVRGTAHE